MAREAWGDTGQMAVDDDDVRLPLVLGPVSNGEFLPLAAAPADVRLARAVLDRAAAAADALAMDRRLFLQTAGGMAALLATINDSLGAQPDAQLAQSLPSEVREAVTYGRPVAQAPAV